MQCENLKGLSAFEVILIREATKDKTRSEIFNYIRDNGARIRQEYCFNHCLIRATCLARYLPRKELNNTIYKTI